MLLLEGVEENYIVCCVSCVCVRACVHVCCPLVDVCDPLRYLVVCVCFTLHPVSWAACL